MGGWEDRFQENRNLLHIHCHTVQRLRKSFESVIETDFPDESIDCIGIPYHKSLHDLETADRYIVLIFII
jgi:hypothetical protein